MKLTRKFVWFVLVTVFLFSLSACENSAVNKLKNTQIKLAFEDIGKTYGEVLDSYCSNTKWRTFSSGYTPMVEFSGETPDGQNVTIQWLEDTYDICYTWELDGEAQDILIDFKKWIIEAANGASSSAISPEQTGATPSANNESAQNENAEAHTLMGETIIYSGSDFDIIQRPYIQHINYITTYDNGLSGADKKYGLARQTDTETIPITDTIYNGIWDIGDGPAAVSIFDPMSGESKIGFINETGEIIAAPKYDEVGAFSGGYAKVRIGEGNKKAWGLVDTSGNEVVPVEFLGVLEDSIQNGFVTVTNYGTDFRGIEWQLYGKYDIANGRLAVPVEYEAVGNFSEGLCAALKRVESGSNGAGERRLGYVNVSGEIAIPFDFYMHQAGNYVSDVYAFSEGLACVEARPEKYNDMVYIFIDKDGNQIGDEFFSAGRFSNGLAVVMPAVFDPNFFMEDVIAVFSTRRYGYADTTGKLAFGGDFSDANPFYGNYTIVRVDSKYHLINKSGIVFKDYELDTGKMDPNLLTKQNESMWVEGLKRVYCNIGEGFGYGFIDKEAQLLANGFVDTGNISDGLIAVLKQEGSKWGYISAETGETAIPYTFDYAGDFSGGVAFARMADTPKDTILQAAGLIYYPLCLIDSTGAQITEIKYIGTTQHPETGAILLSQNIAPFADDKAVVAIANGDGEFSYVELEIVRK